MKRISLAAVLFSLISLSAFGFSEKDIISPAPGTWCNQQALVLSSSNASEIYYSLTGSDPFVSGFAYDGPVLIEKKGAVRVRIGVVETDGIKKEFVIDYTVMPAVLSELDEETSAFAEKHLVKTPLITYRSGSECSLPSGIRYSFEKSRAPFLRQKLTLQHKNFFERYASFFATDGFNNYHSVIRIVPDETAGVEKKYGLPFSITDWNTFTFTDRKFIYQIDDEMWDSNCSEKFLGREVEHVIRWQSVEFAENSTVYEYVLPAIPEVKSANLGNGLVSFSLPEDKNYTFETGEKTVFAEAFFGEETEGSFVPKIYLDGNLCGTISVSYRLDLLAPEVPVISASGDSTFSRKTLALKVECSDEAKIFYAVSEPVYYEESKDIAGDIEIAMPENFTEYDGSDIVIESTEDKSCACKVFVYAVDAAGNASKVVDYLYIIDEFNFYVAPSSESEKADGSFMNPFVSFEQVVAAINSSEGGTRIHLKGDITVNGGEHAITKDCVIHGNGWKLTFAEGASLAVENASVKIDRCSFEKHADSQSLLCRIENGAVSFDDCEIAGFYREDGKLFEVKKSEVSFVDCGITLSANRIAVCGEISGGTLNASGNRFTAIGQSASALKIVNAEASFESNLFTLIGGICKGVDLTGGSISFAGDVFNGQSDGKYRNSGAVFRNGGCKVTGLNSTLANGF
ncbi:MAG: chitobiase/beta-hexosaminidase C-terminal domain-containing protein [Spirochaetales bacterium]|nr:chitobiase/beta-hexosaminidase C-terminal domain-containing protein [Spirochaetales bacterium]